MFSTTFSESNSAAYWNDHAELPAHAVDLDVAERHDVLAVDPDVRRRRA